MKCGLLGSEAGKGRPLDWGRMFANDAKTVYSIGTRKPFDRLYSQERLFGSRLALAAEGGRTASTIAELAINNTRSERRRRSGRYHSRFREGDDDEDKHKHVFGEREGLLSRGGVVGYVRGQSVIVGGGDQRSARRASDRIGFRRSASFHAAELFEELAGMGTTHDMPFLVSITYLKFRYILHDGGSCKHPT